LRAARLPLVLGLYALSITAGPGHQSADSSKQDTLVFRHVHVVNVGDGAIARDHRLTIAGDRIVSIMPESAVAPIAGRVIDAAGAFVIPGLWDMHQHLLEYPGVAPAAVPDAVLPLYIANGVLGVRDMGTHGFEDLARLRTDVETGKVLGPRLVITDRALDGIPPTDEIKRPIATESDARAAVRNMKAAGADFVKVYDRLTRPVYLAVADECRRQALPFVGHVPIAVGVRDAIAAGQRSIEHMGSGAIRRACYAYVPEGAPPAADTDPAQTAAIIAAMNAAFDGQVDAVWRPETAQWIQSPAGSGALSVIGRDLGRIRSLRVLRRATARNGVEIAVHATHERGERTYLLQADAKGTLDLLPDEPDVELASQVRELAAELRPRDVWIVPTLTPLSAIVRRQELLAHPDAHLEFVPEDVRRALDPKNDPRYQAWTDLEWGYMRRTYDRDAHLAAALRRLGVKMMTGTDAVTDYCLPGFGLHEELRLLVQAGFSPLQALQASTLEPAAFLNRTKDMGTVEVGKLADLVLLGADPVADIANAGAIRGVVRSGRYLDRAELDRLLARVKAAVRH